MANKFAQMLEADFAIMNKNRPAHDVAVVTEVIGDVRGKVAILSDDLIVTGSTLVTGAAALKEAGATAVYACATHGLFPDDSLRKLAASELAGITLTDTVPINELERPDKLTVLSVSGILAETIQNVFSDESVSAIFAGENQLF
jgi:ribose-phosphate pyrophosphokinase